MSNIEDVLAARVPPSAPANIQSAIKNALASSAGVRAKRETLAKNPNLSPIGIVDESRKYIATDTAKRIQQARSTAAAFEKQIAARKAKTLPPKPNVSDAPLMSEFRAAMRSMTAKDRQALLFSDPINVQVLQACLGAPVALSGVSEDMLAKAVDRYVTITHPTELTAIADDEESLSVLNAAVGATVLSVKAVGEFSSDAVLETFIETNAPIALKADPSDLLQQLANIVKREPPAPQKTPAQIEADSAEWARNFLAECRAEAESVT